MVPSEITIGPFRFEWDADRHEMYISNGEEVAAMVEFVSIEKWAAFVEATNV